MNLLLARVGAIAPLPKLGKQGVIPRLMRFSEIFYVRWEAVDSNKKYLQLSLFDQPIPIGPFEVGDQVEITEPGMFYGKRAQVVHVFGGSVVVQAKGWYITRTYRSKDLRLIGEVNNNGQGK